MPYLLNSVDIRVFSRRHYLLTYYQCNSIGYSQSRNIVRNRHVSVVALNHHLEHKEITPLLDLATVTCSAEKWTIQSFDRSSYLASCCPSQIIASTRNLKRVYRGYIMRNLTKNESKFPVTPIGTRIGSLLQLL